MKIIDAIHNWVVEKKTKVLLDTYGTIHYCPWCRQIANQNDWSMKEYEKDKFLDILTCGVCQGTSLWRFEFGSMYIRSCDPPKPILSGLEKVYDAHFQDKEDYY